MNITTEQFLQAARHGNRDIIRHYVETKKPIDVKDDNANTALLLAAEKGYLDLVTYLYEQGASTSLANDDGQVPLMLAAYQGHLRVVIYLQDKQATSYDDMAMVCAAKNGHLPIVAHFFQRDLPWDGNPLNDIALDSALENRHLHVVNYFYQNRLLNKKKTVLLMLADDNGAVKCREIPHAKKMLN